MTEPVPSIVDIAYHAALCTLYVTFERHGTFTYYAVPPDVHRAFVAARDPEIYFLDYISDHYFHWKTETLRVAG